MTSDENRTTAPDRRSKQCSKKTQRSPSKRPTAQREEDLDVKLDELVTLYFSKKQISRDEYLDRRQALIDEYSAPLTKHGRKSARKSMNNADASSR